MQHACTSFSSLKIRPVQDICKRNIQLVFYRNFLYRILYQILVRWIKKEQIDFDFNTVICLIYPSTNLYRKLFSSIRYLYTIDTSIPIPKTF